MLCQAYTSFCRPHSAGRGAPCAAVALAMHASGRCHSAEAALCLKPRLGPLSLPLGRAWSELERRKSPRPLGPQVRGSQRCTRWLRGQRCSPPGTGRTCWGQRTPRTAGRHRPAHGARAEAGMSTYLHAGRGAGVCGGQQLCSSQAGQGWQDAGCCWRALRSSQATHRCRVAGVEVGAHRCEGLRRGEGVQRQAGGWHAGAMSSTWLRACAYCTCSRVCANALLAPHHFLAGCTKGHVGHECRQVGVRQRGGVAAVQGHLQLIGNCLAVHLNRAREARHGRWV